MARRAVVSVYVKPKRKSHPHSKNASKGQTGYKKNIEDKVDEYRTNRKNNSTLLRNKRRR